MELTASKVNDVFADCVFKTRPEPGTKYIHVVGIVSNMAFDPKKIEQYSLTIKMMLNELNDNFREDVGGGWSFLQMAYTKSEEHWAEHPTMEKLMMLGIAAGYMKYILPRALWKSLASGVPYLVIVNDRIKVEEEVYAV